MNSVYINRVYINRVCYRVCDKVCDRMMSCYLPLSAVSMVPRVNIV